MKLPVGFLTLCLLAAWSQSTLAETTTFSTPSLDRWSYPFAGNGSEQEARLFSALGAEGFDERDSQFVIAFDTAHDGSVLIPAGLGAANYQIQSLRLTATASSVVGAPAYDGTHDVFSTYLAPDAAGYQADGDVGRPIELFGAGFVGGYSTFAFDTSTDGAPPAFEENNPFGFGPPTGRYVHPLAYDSNGQPLLVSNNVDYLNGGVAAFEAEPFAVGVADLTIGSLLATGTELTFEVNLSDASIVEYLQSGLDQGQLGFVLSTLATSDNFSRLYTKDFPAGSPVRMELDVTVVPEPSTMSLLAVTMLALSSVVWGQLRRRTA